MLCILHETILLFFECTTLINSKIINTLGSRIKHWTNKSTENFTKHKNYGYLINKTKKLFQDFSNI